jgi:hypothetical protein
MVLCDRECSFCPVEELENLKKKKQKLTEIHPVDGDYAQEWHNLHLKQTANVFGEDKDGKLSNIDADWITFLVTNTTLDIALCYFRKSKYANNYIYGGAVELS